MHLKRLEAFGFKSFADKVVFDFEPGVTCFVGPNGCGKSNVVDAVKWVLGEQSAKSLRGGEMLDVIFNGSGNRKQLNVAEVTLTFDNASGKLPLAAPEVSVTRRLYRSGESEYLINKALCRLRDVRELFWDTGVGTSSYSVIEQGRIAALLEANSKDRRILFEEAAGIHKYKERKKIALRKLERVEQNLARLNDLVGEVERNLKTVTRQAEKARKAKEISDKLRQTKLDILLHDAFTSEATLREVTASLNLASERVTALSEELQKAQTATAESQQHMADIDIQFNGAQYELSEARGKLSRLEAEIEAERRSIDELTVEAARAKEASKAAGDRAAAIAQERERVELDGARAQENLAEKSAQAKTLSESVAQEQDAREALIKILETARRAAIDALGRRAQLQDTLGRAEAELGSIEYRVRKSHAQMTKAEDQLRFAQAESEEVRGRMKEVAQRREMLETEQSGLRAVQARTEEEIDRVSRNSQELQRELESRRSRLTALEGLRESGEGLSPGARAVLTNLRVEMGLANEVHGLVADCLGVDPRLEQAIEAALGNHIETIVVDSARAAQLLSARLGENELGRASFLPLDRAEAVVFASAMNSKLDRAVLTHAGCLGCAADLISCDEKYRPIAHALLGDVLVFDTGHNAAESFEIDKGSSGWQRVSLNGGFFENTGVLSGGRYKAQRLGLIGRKNEIVRLHTQMDELRLRIEALAERTGFLEKRAQKVARDEERLRIDLSALSHTHTELKSMLAAIEREESRSAEEKNLAVQEIHELEAERTAHVERVLNMRSELEVSKKAEEDAAAAVQGHEAELATREATLTAGRQQLADMERECATWNERVSALEREGQSLSAQFAERRDESERERARGEALDERFNMAVTTLAEKDRTRAEVSDLIDILSMQMTKLQEQKEESRLGFETARGREREIATEMEKCREELSAVREKEVNLRVRFESKIEQARSEFQIDAMSELTARGGPPEVPAEALEAVRELEEKLARLGAVNMYALEEQQELEKRYGFLKVQFEDLESARASLRDVIARINRRSRTLFQETFEAVKSHFNEIFRKLFGGGKADLILEEGEDILEAGIEILARPPGKEPRSVSLLSGGEKTMTMIALLFAVFRSRPAPFCILDEVDAPLDEANVDRFNMIVREFMDQSQFVVITHNKKTMSYADILYGITMPEPGVSKRIAIKFDEIEKHLPMDEIDRAAREARKTAQAQAAAIKPVDEPAPVAEASAPAEPVAEAVPVEVQPEQAVSGE
jgi:chromosome segregation protein